MFFALKYLLYVYVYFACLYVFELCSECMQSPYMCLVPSEAKRGYRSLGIGMTDSCDLIWVLRIKFRSSGRAVSVFDG